MQNIFIGHRVHHLLMRDCSNSKPL